jgi:PAS domain S-box-containing protein
MKSHPATLLGRLSLILVLAALPVVLLVFHYVWQAHHQVMSQKTFKASYLLERLARSQENLLARTRNILTHLGEVPAVRDLDGPACVRYLQQVLSINEDYLNLVIAQPDGDLICSARALTGRVNVSDRDYFQRALEAGSFAVGTFHVDRVSRQASLGFAYPIFDPQRGRVKAVVIAMVSLETWSQWLGQLALPDDSVAFVVDSNDTIIAHHPPNPRVIGLFAEMYGYNTRSLIPDDAGGAVSRQLRDSFGQERLFAFQPLWLRQGETSLSVGISLPLSADIELANERLWKGVLFIGLCLLVLFSTVLLAMKRDVVRPLRLLLEYSKSLEKDGISKAPRARGASEVKALQAQIANMAEISVSTESDLRTSESRFRQIAETIQEVFWIVSPDWKEILYVNPTYETIWQRSVDSLYRTPESWMASVVPEDRQQVLDYISGLQDGDFSKVVFPLYRIERRDGTIRWISAKGFPTYDPEGNLTSVVGTAEDVTEQKQYEAELMEREAKYRLLVEHAEDLVIKIDTDGCFLFVSPSYCRTFGKSEYQLLGKAFMPMVHEEDQEATREAMKGLYYPPFTAYLEQRAMTAQGWRWFGWSDTAILDEQQQVVEIIGVGRDITQQKKAEFALRESEARYRDLFDNMSDGVVVYQRIGGSDDFLITNMNHAAERMAGLSKEQVVGHQIDEIFPGVKELGLLDAIRQAAADGQPVRCPVSAYRDERIELWVEYHVFRLPSGDVVAVFRDATSEQRAIEALKRSEEKFRGFFEDLSVGLVIADQNGITQEVNKSFTQMFAIDRLQAIGVPLQELLVTNSHSEALDRLQDLLEGRLERYHFQASATLAEERELIANVAIGALYDEHEQRAFIYAIAEDVTALVKAQTERDRLQRELMRTYRLEALGRLAGGIAHDFNNILGAISGFVELAASRLESAEPETILGYLEKSKDNSERAKQLIKQLLIFSLGAEFQSSTPHDFVRVVANSMEMIRSMLPASILIEVHLPDRPFQVVCDPVQIEQVLLNLCINARDAMDNRGQIEVTLERYQAKEDRCASCHNSVEGDWVSLSVSDNGHGLSELEIERIFEPLFSSKDREKGAGLGLSVVHGIVAGYSGHILVDSKPGEGTRFRILLPPYRPVSESDEPEPVSSEPLEELPSTAGMKIMVVDDEASMRQLFYEFLVSEGYEVCLAENGEAALEHLREVDFAMDLILTDQTMPHMSGLELAQKLRDEGCNIPIVLCSGYSDSINEQIIERLKIASSIDKPVNLQSLYRLLKRLLKPDHTAP